MSFSIQAIVLYGHEGRTRELTFSTKGLNIITGKSKTGKSAIIDIIDYCLGRGSYNVAEGEIRKKIAWYGLHLVKDGDDVFIARDNPGPGASTGSQVYLQRGIQDGYPSLEDICKNTTENSLKNFATQFAGISENEHRPVTGTRDPLSANISHALFLCFQKQNTVASQDQLFHRMNEPFLPQSLKDTFPYFLGAVDEDHFLFLSELDTLTKQLRLLEAQEAKKFQAIEVSRSRISRVLNEGKRVGLIPQEYQPVDDSVFEYLENVSETLVDAPAIVQDFGDTIQRLQGEQTSMQRRLSELNQDLRAARTFLSAQNDFAHEATEQKSRLKSIGFFKQDIEDTHHCPICESTLETPTPSVEQINKSMRRVDGLLISVHKESPHIQAHIGEISDRIQKMTDELREVQRQLRIAIAEDQNAQAAQNQLVSRARYLGRLSNFLETFKPDKSEEGGNEQIEEIKRLIAAVRAKLNSDETASRMDTFLNLIGQKMTEYSKQLDLEHSGSSLRLDLKKLTVVADTEDGPIPLNRMGSGENWVGYHVLTHLAIHWWLRKRGRPVPGFLILDQPTQAYYPPDRIEGDLGQIERDADRRAVQALFELMHGACNEIEMPFQLIVLDHAHLRDDWFEKSIVEEWRGMDALVPRDWPSIYPKT